MAVFYCFDRSIISLFIIIIANKRCKRTCLLYDFIYLNVRWEKIDGNLRSACNIRNYITLNSRNYCTEVYKKLHALQKEKNIEMVTMMLGQNPCTPPLLKDY